MLKINRTEFARFWLSNTLAMLLVPILISDAAEKIAASTDRRFYIEIFLCLLFVSPFVLALLFSLERKKE